ncbi:mucoidy inhibitor MuiA family protein [Kamptonema sp. UHCC 0994]|uniref:mucoidy inhibitor MuiA family protein n=1 Tax=Kamptonema sp. UHCC 0994 TaxID=3031329 RepID=UPI0023B9F747|nr:mucoidy inhibitor MuiA family protein [Kamptonema sp. UHCC 0994]MDF0554660.1 mucoidy inhibitor MuiA family protein [Kamptonema sp. UHCC 0994]
MTNSELPNPDREHIKIVDSQISEVTVYTNQARVTRRGLVTLTGNEKELVIASLPRTIQTDSVRATGSGTIAVNLLGVRTEKIFATEPVEEKTRKLSKQIEQLEEQKRTIIYQLASRELQLKFVEGLSDKSVGFFSSSLAKQQVGLNETGELLNFLGQNYRKYVGSIAQLEKQQQQLDKQLQALRQQLQQIQNYRPQESFSIFVAIEAGDSGDFELEVSYMINRASWTPLYDLRVNTTDNQINLSYLAEVNQNTGEDWTNIALTLSTAKPGLGTLPPKLDPWYIDIFSLEIPQNPEFLRAKKAKDRDVTSLSAATHEMELEYIARSPAPGAITAQTVTATASTEGGVVTFQIGGNSNIPNDGNPQKVTIFNENYPSRPEYIAIPRLVSFAYLQAVVINPLTGATLLPGKANIFRDNTFVGTTQLENIAPGQEFKLNLGIDEGLKIERELVERQVDKKLIGNQRRTSYAYRLIITNLRQVQASLTLKEQLPVSRNEQIKVRLTLTNPKVQVGEMGLLEWVIELPPQGKQELYYQFVVENPPDLNVLGLDI